MHAVRFRLCYPQRSELRTICVFSIHAYARADRQKRPKKGDVGLHRVFFYVYAVRKDRPNRYIISSGKIQDCRERCWGVRFTKSVRFPISVTLLVQLRRKTGLLHYYDVTSVPLISEGRQTKRRRNHKLQNRGVLFI